MKTFPFVRFLFIVVCVAVALYVLPLLLPILGAWMVAIRAIAILGIIAYGLRLAGWL